ncbi:MAG: ubiquinone/menaquinone biosynthesis methyltransferase [Bacteroidales bacterium]|jgi:demethylmenaquinone methyltransferase/2-methoxy-6-polyprenyl-1,4-benzoquinol methylase|nr:ubiquinone/menaquinone biosynthesis methyltransferase [Bacteroidales bacterium]
MGKKSLHTEPGHSAQKEARPLYRIFTAVPPSYDLINRLFTLRLDEKWRKQASRECLSGRPGRVMDLCTGTGDLAIRLAKMSNSGLEITGYDYSQPMLDLAKRKAVKAGAGEIVFTRGDAADMPYPENHFDAIGIAFAFRNLTFRNHDTPKFLAEIHRVLKPGGRFVIIESSQPKWPWLRALFRFYTRYIVYPLGSLVSGNKGAYKYLSYSVIHYYQPEEICDLLKTFGFSEVTFKRLTGGISALHVAVK